MRNKQILDFAHFGLVLEWKKGQNFRAKNTHEFMIDLFLAVQNSSIGDLVTNSLTHSLTVLLLLTLLSDPRDLWPLRYLFRVMRRHDMTKKHRKNCECCPVSQLIVRSQRLSWIQVLNCQNCSQYLKYHKSLGLLLSLYLSLSIFLVMSCFLITLNKCLKGSKSLVLLFVWQK